MEHSSNTVSLALLAGAFVIAACIAAYLLAPKPQNPRTLAIAASLPSLLIIGLFYSLVIHIHRTLGQWPDFYGEHGFPEPLRTHARITGITYFLTLLFNIYAWPILFLLSGIIRRLRVTLPFLAIYALSFYACYAAMGFAPAGFMKWWLD